MRPRTAETALWWRGAMIKRPRASPIEFYLAHIRRVERFLGGMTGARHRARRVVVNTNRRRRGESRSWPRPVLKRARRARARPRRRNAGVPEVQGAQPRDVAGQRRPSETLAGRRQESANGSK